MNQVATAGPKLQPLKIGSDLEVLKSVIRKQMLRVGIRAANFPDEEEKALLIEYVQKSYGQFTDLQIDEAFTLALDGKLSIDPNPYENFSCMYFGKIMTAYKNYLISEGLVKKNTDRERQFVEPARQIEAGMANWEPHFDEVKAKVQAGRDPGIFPSNIYDWLVNVGKIDAKAFRSHLQAASSVVKARLQADLSEASHGQRNALKNVLEKVQAESENALIICEAKRMAVIEYCKG